MYTEKDVNRHKRIRDYIYLGIFALTALISVVANDLVISLFAFSFISIASAFLYSYAITRSDRKAGISRDR
jgi:NADH:ubiquinone oxidoreductase subunit 5 (subunit L)/multisubunit Na+/H+ antiporter MnhA subunit